ncbi:MAG: hypothetical protein JSR19_09900 [Proteobacteria bacterium]|nr:hypothetical protein [Pseudomonadota bacterium]HQR03178.1 hypothetical protein [Rhodocyclaceae bacterium]
MSSSLIRRLVLLLSILCCPGAWAGDDSFAFGLFGDTPYTPYERQQLPSMLEAMAQSGLAFAIHAGDIKSGAARCDDEVYTGIHTLFQAAPLPIVYVPGDNEWMDCSRILAGRFDPVERLEYLRGVFFSTPQSLGHHPVPLERQPRYPENARWERGGVLFATLNMPGPDNNIGNAEEYPTRNAANLAWMGEAFRIAREKNLRGLLLDIQANPWIEANNEGVTKPGFVDFFRRLREELARFHGQVVLAHGDTHSIQINQPLQDIHTRRTIANFTRVETYGSPFMGWVRVVVDAQNPEVFRFERHPWAPHSPF